MYPFAEEYYRENTYIRTFSANVSEEDLLWHWDDESRIIEPIEENDWFFQFDNELPIPIKEKIYIEKGRIHRVIKGSTDLRVKIVKLSNG